MNFIMHINVEMQFDVFVMLINVKMPTIIMLINVKMPTIVDILTFISMINTSESLKARKAFFSILAFMGS